MIKPSSCPMSSSANKLSSESRFFPLRRSRRRVCDTRQKFKSHQPALLRLTSSNHRTHFHEFQFQPRSLNRSAVSKSQTNGLPQNVRCTFKVGHTIVTQRARTGKNCHMSKSDPILGTSGGEARRGGSISDIGCAAVVALVCCKSGDK